MEFSFFWTKKNVKLNHIESYKPRERYQANIALSNNDWDWYKISLQWWIISQSMDW